MSHTISPNMGLVVPGVGTEPSPTWATDLNSSLGTIDAHNHTPGEGVQIPPGGLNINTDLPFNDNNAVNLRSSRYQVQTSPLAGTLDLGCVYVSGVDLYFNDENGNQIQITKNGSIAGTSGSIANLTSPASASYVSISGTFVWQQDTNQAANMDFAAAILRDTTASSPGITLTPPSGLAADYTLTLPPAAPSMNSVLVMDSSGNVTTSANPVDLTLTGTLTVPSITVAGALSVGSLTSAGDVDVDTRVVAIDGFFPSGGGGPSLVSFSGSNNEIDVVNAAQNDGRPLVTAEAVSIAFFCGGAVDYTGTIFSGSGFTVTNVSPSVGGVIHVTIAFIITFANTPTIVLGAYSSTSGIASGVTVETSSVSSSGCVLIIGDSAAPWPVTFLAFGQRP